MKTLIIVIIILLIAGYFTHEVYNTWMQDESEESENPTLKDRKDRYKYPKK